MRERWHFASPPTRWLLPPVPLLPLAFLCIYIFIYTIGYENARITELEALVKQKGSSKGATDKELAA